MITDIGKQICCGKACPSATLSTTNPRYNTPRLNPAF